MFALSKRNVIKIFFLKVVVGVGRETQSPPGRGQDDYLFLTSNRDRRGRGYCLGARSRDGDDGNKPNPAL